MKNIEHVLQLEEWNLIPAFSTTISLPQSEDNSPTTLSEQESNGGGWGRGYIGL